MQKVEHLA